MAGYRIPDNDVAAFPVQSQIFEVDLAILAAAYSGFRVVSGCAVTQQGSPDMTVAVAAGVVEPGDGTIVTVTSGNLTVSTAHATLIRLDLISASATGVKTITAGTAATVAAVKPPSLPANHTALAIITVPPTTTAITSDLILDRRLFVEPFAPVAVKEHGTAGATETFDFTDGPAHRATLDQDLAVTLATSTPTGQEAILTLELIEDGTGGWIVSSWDAAIVWTDGVAPTMDTAIAAINLFQFRTTDGGTTWLGVKQDAGAIGPAGGAIAIPYVFSTTTTDSDPGAGTLRLSNATQNAATVIRADLADALTATVTAILDSLDDSTNTVKGHIRLFKSDDPSKWLLFTLSSIASPSGYRNLTVSNVASSASSPFADGDDITLAFSRAGDAGAAGSGAYVGCKAYHSTTQNINNSVAALLFDSEEEDTHAFHFTSAANLTGTVAKSAASADIVGTGTAFTSELSVNQVVQIPGTANERFVVKTITDDTHFTAWAAAANSATGQTAVRVNSAFAVPAGKAGWYVLRLATFCSAAGNYIGIRKNGLGSTAQTTVVRGSYVSLHAAGYWNASVGTRLAEGDFVEVLGSTGASVNLGHASLEDARSSFEIQRVAD